MEWLDPVTSGLKSDSLTLFSVPPPASGAVLAAILNIIDSFSDVEDPDPVFYHRLVETFKWAYAARSNLGDPFDQEITEFIWFVDVGADSDL